MKRLVKRGFTLVELMVVIAIIGLLASVLATSVVSKMKQASHDLDKKVLKDLYDHLSMKSSTDEKAREKFNRGPISEKRGREFWEACFKHGVLGPDMLPKMIAKSGQDFEVDRRALDNRDTFMLDPMGCSWTAPQGNELAYVLTAKGKSRRVVICANERNWLNHDDEVIAMWSDGETAEYTTLEELQNWGYEITPEHWMAPATELFGKVKPFDGVFD